MSFDYQSDEGIIHIDAFKTTNNDQIIASKDSTAYGGLRWVSLGRPKLVSNDMVVISNEKISIFFTMLTLRDKEELKNEVKRVKGINVDTKNFVDIPAKSVDCAINIYDNDNLVILKGNVIDFVNLPYEIQFKYFPNAPERKAFEKRIKSKDSLDFECEVTSGTKIKRTNTFTLTLDEINNMQLIDQLFGPASEIYVSRQQLTNLANDIYLSMNVIEDYQIAGDQFSSNFVDELIRITSTGAFQEVLLSDAFKSLSKYSLDVKQDLSPDVINNQISNIFQVETVGDKKRIVVNNDFYKSSSKENSKSVDTSVNVGYGGFSLGTSVKYANDNKDSWVSQDKSLTDQMNELNTLTQSDVKLQFSGTKIVAKSLNVAKLQAGSFKKTLSFNRIKNTYYEADFMQKFTLLTRKLNKSPDLGNRFPKYTVLTIGSSEALSLFDADGKGTNTMTGWYICNGKNGTPDLRGRFLVGKNEEDNDYKAVGNTGGLNKVQLTVDQMPSHMHENEAHSHLIYMKTEESGSHTHNYKDIFYSENPKWLNSADYVDVPSGFGSSKTDYDNKGFQINRVTDASGYHSHLIWGYSHESKINIQKTGGNNPFENRPPYYVVQYIMFLPN